MRAVTVCFALATLALPAAADTLVLKGGKKLEGVVVSSSPDDPVVVVNPYNSRCREMTYGITEKERFPRDKVVEFKQSDPPLVEYRERASKPGLTAEEHVALAKFCETSKFAEEREREYRLTLCIDPSNAEALAALGRANWAAWAKGNPLADPDLRLLESEYVQMQMPAEAEAHWDQMVAKGTTRQRIHLERARRSKKQPLGRRDKVPLTVKSELSTGANYCIYLPKTYDPLVPTGLVVGLHGGGANATNPTIVTGNGQEAMNFYMDVSEERGVIVVCPSALEAPWGTKKNEVFLDALIEEMKILYNVDENRIWLTGHSMGGFGAWDLGPRRADVWAAFAPCAGAGSGQTAGLPIYVYHGTDDRIVGVTGDRAAAEGLKKDRADFVYTEIDKVGHGFPDWVRHDIFRFFTGRWKDDGKKRATGPRSSFDRKATKDEIKCFGDPSATSTQGAGDAKLGALVADLEKGGGRGLEAAKQLSLHKDAATVAAVGKVLHSKKAASDAKVLAANVLGDIGLPDGVKPLAAEAATEDFRVLDAVVESLGKLGGKDAVEPLVRAGKQFGLFWEKANQGGRFDFTEYELRCQSFGRLCVALGATGDAAAAVPVIEKEIVVRVYAPKTPYAVPIDDRFTEIPPRARRELMERLAACLVALKDPRGKSLLTTAKTPWAKEAPLVAAADAAIAQL
jgi:acetyl esterase/lipase